MMRHVAAEQRPTQAEVQNAVEQAVRDARTAAQDMKTALQDATTAAQDARTAAQDALANAQAPTPVQPPGTIVFPTDGGNPVSIRVDGEGIHLSQNGNETVVPIRDVVPRGAVQITALVSAALIAVALLGPLLRFFLRRHERRALSAQLSTAVQARLDAMDRNIDTVAVELERVSEGQRFTAKLLEQRPLEHAQRIDR